MPIVTDHPAFLQVNMDTTIWRFVDIYKFLSMMQNKSIVFAQAKKLAERDPKEGHYTQADQYLADKIDNEITFAIELMRRTGSTGTDEELWHLAKNTAGSLPRQSVSNLLQNRAYASCWNMSEHEPVQLWSLYSSEHSGLAIKAKLGDLIENLEEDSDETLIGAVKYVDYSKTHIPLDNAMTPFFTKRIEFSHEKEIRLAKFDFSGMGNISETDTKAETKADLLPILTHKLKSLDFISEIRLAPFMEDWKKSTVYGLCENFNLQCKMVDSSIIS